jgi:deoxyribonuclease-4
MAINVNFGTAGIPISSVRNDTISGIARVRELGLQALEVEFVRGVHMSNETAKKVGAAAKEHGIDLSVHAPYYVNLASDHESVIAESKKRILDSLERGAIMGAKIVVVHAGFYGKNCNEGISKIKDACAEIAEKMRKEKWNITLGIETSGKQGQFGSLSEIIELCRGLKECAPVIDFAHIYARQAGHIDYEKVLDAAKNYSHLHCHFSGINYSTLSLEKGNERNHEPVGRPEFAPLAREILKRKLDITLICESPLLEVDALKMKNILEHLAMDTIEH